MKRISFILLTVLVAVSCRKASPEERIAKIANYFDKTELSYPEDLQRFEGQKRIDYLTLTLAKELGADDVWTLEHAGANSLAAEFPGRENRITRYAYLSASLDDPEACAAVLNTLKAFKDMRIKPKGTFHALFYSTARDSAGVNGLGAIFREDVQAGDQITFDMELSTRDTLPDRTFIIEDKAFFADQLIEVVPPYLEPLGSFDFKKGRYPNRHWQVSAPTYRYSFDPAALRKESAAITTFALLLN